LLEEFACLQSFINLFLAEKVGYLFLTVRKPSFPQKLNQISYLILKKLSLKKGYQYIIK